MDASTEPAKRLLSVADYHLMGEAGVFAPDERVELIEGEIIAMPPIGPPHASIVDRLTERLVVACVGRAIVRVWNPVRLSDFTEPQPDLALLRHRDDYYATAAPTPADTLLAIEVADSTLKHDRRIKAPLYARHGVPELWVIDVRTALVVLYREPSPTGYASETERWPPGTLEPSLLDGVRIDLSELFGVG